MGKNPPDAGEASLRSRIQKGYQKRDPNPEAFRMLPRELVDEIGEFSHKGARLDLAVLSNLVYWFSKRSSEMIQFEQGFEIDLQRSQFVLSMESTAEDIFSRWFFEITRESLYTDEGTRLPHFENFYRRIVYSFKRLQKLGMLSKVQYVNPKFMGLYGTVWELGPILARTAIDLPKAPNSPSIIMHSEREEEGPYVNAIDRIGTAFCSETSEAYREAQVCVNVYDRRRTHDHEDWTRCMATGVEGPRHASIGAFRPGEAIGAENETPCTVPWVVLEPEEGDVVDRYEATKRVLEMLDLEEVKLSQVVVAFSGNNSFHIRIPQGMFGNPVYRSTRACSTILKRWSNQFEEHFDVNLFDPRHLVRNIGSRHEKGSYTTAFTGDEFMSLTLEEITGRSLERHHFTLNDPRFADASPALVMSLLQAGDTLDRFYMPPPEEVPDLEDIIGGVMQRALKGCEEGEQWHDRHMGRSKLCFVVACRFLELHDEVTAWEELERVNERNSPPLPQKELNSCFKSARNTLARKRR